MFKKISNLLSKQLLFFTAAILALTIGLSGCSRNAATGKNELQLISQSAEIAMGKSQYSTMQQAEGGQWPTHPEVVAHVQEVGKRLAAASNRSDLPYEFVVLSNMTPNAWALPGGKIAINLGLLLELHSDAELAAVLSHEIAHCVARHSAKQLERDIFMQLGIIGLQETMKDNPYGPLVVGTSAIGSKLIHCKYSRSAELEADHYGIAYMAKSGYDPQAAVALQQTFLKLFDHKDRNWLSALFASHPPSQERIDANRISCEAFEEGGSKGFSDYEAAMKNVHKRAYEDLKKGEEALEKRDFQTALNYAHHGLTLEPNEGHLHFLKGRAEAALQKKEQALDSYCEAIACNPSYFGYYRLRANLYKELGQWKKADADLSKCNELLPQKS